MRQKLRWGDLSEREVIDDRRAQGPRSRHHRGRDAPARPRPQRPHRRDRRRQVPAGRCRRPAARRPRPRAAWSGPAPPGRSWKAPSSWAIARSAGGSRNRASRRRITGWSSGARSPPKAAPAPGSTAAPPPSPCSAGSARRWSISTASTRPSRCCGPRPSATSSMPSPAPTPERTALREAHAALGAREEERHSAPGATRCAGGPTTSATSSPRSSRRKLMAGEEEQLETEARRLRHAATLVEQAQRLAALLDGAEGEERRCPPSARPGGPAAGEPGADRPRAGRLAGDARCRLRQSRRAGPRRRRLRRWPAGEPGTTRRDRAAPRPDLPADAEARRDGGGGAGHRRRGGAELDLLDTADVDLRQLRRAQGRGRGRLSGGCGGTQRQAARGGRPAGPHRQSAAAAAWPGRREAGGRPHAARSDRIAGAGERHLHGPAQRGAGDPAPRARRPPGASSPG